MRFEPRQNFVPATSFGTRPAVGDLPIDLAFLESFGVARSVLWAAATRAAAEGTTGCQALTAEGATSEALYYRALAIHLGVPFIDAWPHLAEVADLRDGLLRGRARLTDGSAAWVVAPSPPAIRDLLAAKALGLDMPDIAIAAPAHFAALLEHRAQTRIARRASHALPLLAPRLSACGALSALGNRALVLAVVALLADISWGSHLETDVWGLVFLAGLLFRLCVSIKGLRQSDATRGRPLPDRALPTYTILVPLRDEADVVPELVAALAALDYPRAKREVLFLVEPEDATTRAALLAERLPAGFRIVDLPPGAPRMKPRALNVGLLAAKGDLVTIYDAEDRPERDQLRRAASHFADAPADLACLQARLAIANGASGLLPRLFAIEYAALFDVFNVGLARLRLPIPLGGTSNHFRAAALRAVGGWDAWNVTEDADLGMRLARFGYATDVLASTTFEEAPERLDQWLKQRRRWTKGWMQTLIVMIRDLPAATRDLGPWKVFVVALLLTNLVTGPLLTPAFLIVVLWHLYRDGIAMPHDIEAVLAVSVIALGVLSTLWPAWLGARRRATPFWRSLPAILPYQLMISAAACWGFLDLIRNPHHWHKTPHGAAARRIRRPASAAPPLA